MKSFQILGIGFAAALLAAIGAPANAQALQRIGNSCPNGYYPSGGNFCKGFPNAKHAIPNPGGGGCPSGYDPSGGGNYCVSFK
jgi:hypothetical protein